MNHELRRLVTPRPSSERLRSRRLGVMIVALASGCTVPPTEVLVSVSTDLQGAQLNSGVLRAVVRSGNATVQPSALADADLVRCIEPPLGDAATDGFMDALTDVGFDATLDARADATFGDVSHAPCTSVRAQSGAGGLVELGTFAVVPRAGGPRDEAFELLVSLETPSVQLRRLVDDQRLIPGSMQRASVVLRSECDRVRPPGGGLCGALPCTVEEACRAHGSHCGETGGVAACVSDGVCDPGETACLDPACPAMPGDGCCSPGESVCTPEPACAPRVGDHCCSRDAGETACNEPACPAMIGDGCCSPTETICGGETACSTRPNDGCCSPGENHCNAPSDCAARIGDGCCTPPENSCTESVCAVQCGDGCCMPSVEFGCNCAADCPTALAWGPGDPGIGHMVGTTCAAGWCSFGTATPAGYFWYGPYTMGVPSGHACTVYFTLATDNLSAVDGSVVARLDVNDADTGGLIAGPLDVPRSRLTPLGSFVDVPLTFTAPNCHRLEFRIYWPQTNHVLQARAVNVQCM